jgi:S1-C subfamily serine protease
MEPYNNLYTRALRAIGGRPIDKVVERTRAIVGPPLKDLEGDAHDGLAAFKRGTKPTAAQVAALQAIIRSMRPSALSHAGSVDALPEDAQPAFPSWVNFVQMMIPHLYTIGRVDRKSSGALPPEPYGTGFLISPELFLTNHHVVTQLSGGTDVINLGDAEIRFVQEYNSPDEAAVDVVEVHQFHEEEDAAILRLAPAKLLAERKPLAWSNRIPNESDHITVVGYPFPDSTRNPLFMDQIFGGNKLGVKRLAPGEVIGARKGAVYHDCSTLGGNSGSPLVDMTTGAVVGLHRDGYFLARNEAVSVAVLQDLVGSYRSVI